MANDARISADKKFKDMQKRQQAALNEQEAVLEATRAKTARLRALRLEKEDAAQAGNSHKSPPAKRRAAGKS